MAAGIDVKEPRSSELTAMEFWRGQHDIDNATEHCMIFSRPEDGDARGSYLLVTMLQRLIVRIDMFQESL